jgi:hypothetical protein
VNILYNQTRRANGVILQLGGSGGGVNKYPAQEKNNVTKFYEDPRAWILSNNSRTTADSCGYSSKS